MANSERKKQLRIDVFEKYDGCCAYCGCELDVDNFQIDHIIPKCRYKYGRPEIVGSDDFFNLMPACSSCISCKSDLSLEAFRHRVLNRITRLNNNSTEYQIAKRFGLLIETNIEIQFYFEKINNG